MDPTGKKLKILPQLFQWPVFLYNNRIQHKRYDKQRGHRNLNKWQKLQVLLCNEFFFSLFLWWKIFVLDVA
jgi:hypothetical protein